MKFNKKVSTLLPTTLTFLLLGSPLANAEVTPHDPDEGGINNPFENVVELSPLSYIETEELGKEVPIPQINDDFIFYERQLTWRPTTKSYVGMSYGKWKYAGASTVSGGSLSASHTSTVSHTYSGSLKIPVKTLEEVVGFNVTKTWNRSVTYTSKSYPKGSYRLMYRHVYKIYKVKQVQQYDPRARIYDTKYVYPK